MDIVKYISNLSFFRVRACRQIPLMNERYHNRFLIIGGILEMVVALLYYFCTGIVSSVPFINFITMFVLLRKRQPFAIKLHTLISNVVYFYQIKNTETDIFTAPVLMIIAMIKVSIHTRCILTSTLQFLVCSIMSMYVLESHYKSIFFAFSKEELWELFSRSLRYSYVMSGLAMVYIAFYNLQGWTFIREVENLQGSLDQVNEQLKSKNEDLQRTVRLKDLYVLTFSHELKNALNALLGNIELCMIECKETKIVSLLQSAFASGQSISNFVHNMLETGRIENGSSEVVPEPTDVPSFLQKTWQVLREMIRNKRLDGSLSVSANLPRWLELDAQRLQQKILNLVSNAVKFTEKGYIRVFVSWEKNSSLTRPGSAEIVDSEQAEPQPLKWSPEKKFIQSNWGHTLTLEKKRWAETEKFQEKISEGEEGTLTIQIIDSGCGIQQSQITNLGEKLPLGNQSNEARNRGNGLGLWITKQLLLKLKGELLIQSRESQGSTFTMKIPTKQTGPSSLSLSYIETAASLRMQGNKDSTTSLNLRNTQSLGRSMIQTQSEKKVLIVDDDSFNVELMQNFLNKLQIPYFTGYDGKDAIDIVRTNAADISLIITDNYMPGITGIAAVPQIREIYREKGLQQIPIFCVSADETAKFKDECKEAGMNGLLRKPLDFARFRELVLKHAYLVQ